ncbi:MAG: tRNA pseudouridine(38-40) synthase TruA [Christensenellales bacterium]|jgi:tRNA pseudouridine38-40 synthase
MARIKLIIEYDGSGYAGWQTQKNAVGVQQAVEEAIEAVSGIRTAVHGSGRTDAGVHAYAQTAHFDTESSVPPDKWMYALNALLPPDIRVTSSGEADGEFHARFSATGKKYVYTIFNAPHAPALLRNMAWHVFIPLDIELMTKAAEMLVGKHDFAAFAATGSSVKDTVRTIYSVSVKRDGRLIKIEVCGDGFLYNMVRIIAGTLVVVGSKKLEPECIALAIEKKDRNLLGPTAPAHGLALAEVYYD